MKQEYRVAQEFHEIPQIQYCEPSGHTSGVFGIRFQNEFGFSYQYVNLQENYIIIYIPFRGSEQTCWDCGGNRELIIRLDLNGDLEEFDEACDVRKRRSD